MKEFDQLVKVVRILRSPKGCPWDRAQKVRDYERYLLEEAYELIEGIRHKKSASVKEELGDLFLILVMIAEFYREKGEFNHAQVLKGITTKLIARHPHVFSTKKLKDKDEVLAYWIRSKAKKKKRKNIKDRLPLTAPALLLAEIYFKEKYNLAQAKEHVAKKVAIDDIVRQLKSLDKGSSKEAGLAKVLLDISEFAFQNRLEPESLLREKVLSQAQQQKY